MSRHELLVNIVLFCVDSDMEEWMSAINAHIFVKYKVARSITTDFTEEGEIGTSFWFIPSSSSGINRLPVPIRTLPFIDGMFL